MPDPVSLGPLFGAMFPGEAPGEVICAAFGAPVGAGDEVDVVLMEFCPE